MKRFNKRAFTLIEMLLAIAVSMIIVGLFLSLIISIRSSYYRAYNDDDCADIAAMYATALENQILDDIAHHHEDTITLDANSIMVNNVDGTGDTFDFDGIIEDFNRASGVPRKWDIRMICYYDASTCEFFYKFYFIDNYVTENYVHYEYEGSFWIPYYQSFENPNLGSGDMIDPSSADPNAWDYNMGSVDVPFSIDITPSINVVCTDGALSADGDGNTYNSRAVTNNRGTLSTDDSDNTDDRTDIPQSQTITITFS